MVRRTELLIVHVAALGGSRLLVRRGRPRVLGSATVEHDSRDLAQSGRIDRKVVSFVEKGFFPVAKCNEKGCRGRESQDGPGGQRIRPVYKIAQASLLGGGPSGEPVS